MHLDAMRAFAALLVVASHLSAPEFGGHLFLNIPQMAYGHEAVIIFFVLSGYVIAWVADEKEQDAGSFLNSRLARLYSVLIPALILTPLLDAVGREFDPNLYSRVSAVDYWFVRLFANAFHLQTIWFFDIHYFSNGPMWSLAYEFWYYVIFCILVFVPSSNRCKWPMLAALVILIGPKIALYGAVWFLGVAVYRVHKWDKGQGVEAFPLTIVFFGSLAAFAFIYLAHEPLRIGSGALKNALYDFCVGLVVALNILSFKYIHPVFSLESALVRYLASISFSIYLFHYPLLCFYRSVLGLESIEPFLRVPTLVVLTWLSIHLLSYVSERQKRNFRTAIEALVNLISAQVAVKLKVPRRGI